MEWSKRIERNGEASAKNIRCPTVPPTLLDAGEGDSREADENGGNRLGHVFLLVYAEGWIRECIHGQCLLKERLMSIDMNGMEMHVMSRGCPGPRVRKAKGKRTRRVCLGASNGQSPLYEVTA